MKQLRKQENGEPHHGSAAPHGFLGERWARAGLGHVRKAEKSAAATIHPGRYAVG